MMKMTLEEFLAILHSCIEIDINTVDDNLTIYTFNPDVMIMGVDTYKVDGQFALYNNSGEFVIDTILNDCKTSRTLKLNQDYNFSLTIVKETRII